MLAVHSVSKRFGRLQAVRDVSFHLRKGEVVGLLGPNGAGKTTTIRMISGYLPPDSGRVEVAGHDALSDSLAARKCLGYLPESAPLYGEMKTADYLHYRARLFDIPRARRAAAVDQALERCWLRDVRRRRVGKLSKGYKQRVGLAAALLHNPSLLILDEPTNGLDPTQIRETRSLIRELAADRTVLLSSHVLPEVELTCDRVIIIGLGRLRADANLADLIGRNAHPTVIAEVAGPSPGLGTEVVRRALAAAEGAGRVELDPVQPTDATAGWARWRITPVPGAHDLREPIARAAAAAGLLVRELRREAPTLEKLFASLINTPLPDSPLPV